MKKMTCIDDRYNDGGEWDVEDVDLDREVADMEYTFRAYAREAAESAVQIGEDFDLEGYLETCREEYRDGLRIYDETTGEWRQEGDSAYMHYETGSIYTLSELLEQHTFLGEDGRKEEGAAMCGGEWQQRGAPSPSELLDMYINEGIWIEATFINGEWVAD